MCECHVQRSRRKSCIMLYVLSSIAIALENTRSRKISSSGSSELPWLGCPVLLSAMLIQGVLFSLLFFSDQQFIVVMNCPDSSCGYITNLFGETLHRIIWIAAFYVLFNPFVVFVHKLKTRLKWQTTCSRYGVSFIFLATADG